MSTYKKIVSLLTAFVLCAVIFAVIPFSASAVENVATGKYFLKNMYTGNYMSLKTASDSGGIEIVMRGFDPNEEVYDQKDKDYSYVLAENATPNFVFKLEANGDGLSLQPSHSSTRNIAVSSIGDLSAVKTATLKNDNKQKWVFKKVSDGIYEIHLAADPSFVIGSKSNKAVIRPYESGRASQQWQLTQFKLGSYRTFDPEKKLRYGIDVSVHNDNINWQAVKEYGVEYVFARCGYGDDKGDDGKYSQDDANFLKNYNGSTSEGLDCYLYLYSFMNSKKHAEEEAKHAVRLMKQVGYPSAFPLYLDLEDDLTAKCTNAQILEYFKIFVNYVESNGFTVGIYANRYWWTTKLTDPYYDNFTKWVAEFNTSCQYTKPYTYWQFTECGRIGGITKGGGGSGGGNVDLNADVSSLTGAFVPQSYNYTGKPVEMPVFNYIYGNKQLILGKDYTVKYYNNINAGKASAVLTGMGEYAGFTKTLNYTIKPISVSKATAKSVSAKYYTGKAIKPTVSLTYGGKKLLSGVDYTVAYSNNKTPGTAKITVTGKGNYKSAKTLYFTVKKLSMSKATVKGVKDKVYKDGKARTLSITVKTASGKVLKLDKDYTVKYKNNNNFGKAKVIITAKNKKYYSGTVTKYFSIVPATVKMYKPTKVKKKSVTLNFSHADYATRYVIYRADKKDGKYKKIGYTANRWVHSYKDTGLKRKTKYYYKVAARKAVKGKQYYGKMSEAVTVKTK